MLPSTKHERDPQNHEAYHQERTRSSATACFAADCTKKNHGVTLVIRSAVRGQRS